MGFLERAIRRGVSEGIGKVVGQAITKAVEPTATELANKAAQHFDNAAQQNSRPKAQIASGLEGAFANLERAAQGYATEMSKNIKVCPNCNQPSDKEKLFCPSCGTKLPETTVSEGAVCTECNKQNPVGAKFCDACGAKLTEAQHSFDYDCDKKCVSCDYTREAEHLKNGIWEKDQHNHWQICLLCNK